jgi:hypothetical protein
MGHYCIREMRCGLQERHILARSHSRCDTNQVSGSMNGNLIPADYRVNSGEIGYALHRSSVNRSLNFICEFPLLRPRPPTTAAPGLPNERR